MTIKCPKCHRENPHDSKFCGECGTPLKPSKKASVTKTFQSPLSGRKKNTVIAGKYKIIEQIGEGGMGVVYKAKDTRLERTVALKFLPPELTRDKEAKQRFLQEARAAAALDHPNICTVYEVDETDGQTFISMSYIQGQNLKDKLKEGPLDIDKAKDITLQVAEGLKEAHEKGIIHRDIKPANIMLTEKGRAKITDFGLAKLSWGVDLTKTSTVMGTAAYMSPEQARGDKVDHRTDIWSLGAMFYEMLSGKAPFQRDHEQALIFAVINDKPTPLSLLRSDIPSHIENVIEKAMAKKADQRYQKVGDFIQDLMQSQVDSPSKSEKSIAVLPFVNMSADVEQEYFCDGMAEEIINALTQIENLKVIARTSVFMFKGKNEDIREIGRKLAVKHILEGSVRKAGNKIRITAQLIKVDDGSHLWSEKYDRQMEEIFNIQDNIALAIVENLKVKLMGEERKALLEHPTTNEYAYQLYLQGRFYWNRMTLNDLENAVTCFNKAIESDPDFALAHFGLADTYWVLHQMVPLPAREAMPKAKEAALKALELDSTLAEAFAMVGMILYAYEWNWPEAEAYFEKANKINPRSGPVKMYYSSLLQLTERKSEAIQMMEETLETDPYSLVFLLNVATRLYCAKQYEESIQKAEYILGIEPNFSLAYGLIGRSYICMGLYDKAAKTLEKANELTGGRTESLSTLGYVYAKQGKKREAENILSRLDKESHKRYVPAFFYTYIYNGLGDTDKTFEFLNKAVQERDPLVAWWIRDELFSNLRNDRRYADIIRTVGQAFLEPELMNQFPKEQPKPSIIVLPFEDISPDKDNEYFSDGLTEEIITDLSHIHDLLVISCSSAMTFKGSKKIVRDIAGEANVRYVLEGSVRKAGNNLRITAQLIDAGKDVHLWAEKYSGTLDDVFDIQEKVSLAIAEALKIQLTPVEKHEIDDHPLTDMKAYDCYLRAKQEYLHYKEESLETAIALIQEGLQSVGENALLYSLLGQVYWTFVNVGIRLDAVWLDRAEACVKKIFALDKGSAQGYFLQGLIDYKRGDTQVSVRHTKLALEKDPAHSDAIDHLLWMYADAGRTEQSESYIKRILEIDPFTPHNHWVIGWTRVTQGNFAAGLPYFEKTYTMDPGNPIWRLLYAHQLYLNGKMKEGDAVVNTMDRETPGEMLTSMALLFRHAFRGDKKKALSHITDDMLLFGRWDELIAWMLAQAYALLEEKEEALLWLDHAADRGFINYPFFNEIDPCLENIRGEARFKKLMKRVKKEWENFEV